MTWERQSPRCELSGNGILAAWKKISGFLVSLFLVEEQVKILCLVKTSDLEAFGVTSFNQNLIRPSELTQASGQSLGYDNSKLQLPDAISQRGI